MNLWKQKISVRILEKCERAAPLPLGPAAHIYQQSSFTPSPNRYRLKNSHNLVRPYVFIKMNNQDEEAPPPGARAEDPSAPVAPPHQYSDDQRPMSKQKEALASAYLKRSHFSAALLTELPVIYFLPCY